MDCKKNYEELVLWVKTWFDKNGKDCVAVIGESGGKDSFICSKICVDALGKDRVIGVSIPDAPQGLNDADKICEYLGIKHINFPIGKITAEMNIAFNRLGMEMSNQTMQNIPPRARMMVLYAIAQTMNGRVCCTDNASENYIGYSTLFGDDAGSFSPLGNLTATEVCAIGDFLGLPYKWVHKTPDDGLPHSSPDEEKLGFTYATLDKYIREGVEPDAETKEKIDRMHKNSQFKRDIIRIPAYEPDIWR